MTRHWLKAVHRAACALLLLAGGCSESDSPRDPNQDPKRDAATAPADAGKQGPDPKHDGGPETKHDAASGDGDGDGDGDEGQRDDAGMKPRKPIEGGEGCGEGSLCLNLRNAYAEALQEAKSCTANDHASCGKMAKGSLGCIPCPVWVTETSYLDALSKQFDDAGCDKCFFGSPTGDRCHPVGCNDLGVPMCDPSGTCVPDISCPEHVKDGVPCTDDEIGYCGDATGGCVCLGVAWTC